MLFNFTEIRCIFEVLSILDKGKSKYSFMFRKTKVSHTTLQRVLKQLVEKKLLVKHNKGHQDVDYEITEKGRKLLGLLLEMKNLLK